MNDLKGDSTLYPGGEARFSFRMFAAYDHPICCTTADPRVIEYVISKVDTADRFDPVWHLTIRIGPVHSTEEIDEIGNAMKDDIFDRLSLALNIRIDQIRMIGHPLTPRRGGGAVCDSILPMPLVSISGRAGGRQLLANDIQTLRDIAKAVPLPNEALVSLYRSALTTDDPVAKFLILYLIVYEVSGNDRQRRTDALILKYAPETVTTPSQKPPKNGASQPETETIYTRLRNEICHRSKAKLEETRGDIVSNLDAFQKIVHQVLTHEGVPPVRRSLRHKPCAWGMSR